MRRLADRVRRFFFLKMDRKSERRPDRLQRQQQFQHAEVLSASGLLSKDVVRADKLREVLERLHAVSDDGVPIVVEGKRDREALRKLGFAGEILTLHGRGRLYEFAEEMHAQYTAVILLLDWDEKGELLQSQVGELLSGLWEEFSPVRESLKNLCQKDIRDVQGIPALLYRLAGTEVVVGDSPSGGILR